MKLKLSSDPAEDKARKAAAALALLGLLGLGRSQHNPQAWAIGGGGQTYLEKLDSGMEESWIDIPTPVGQLWINGGVLQTTVRHAADYFCVSQMGSYDTTLWYSQQKMSSPGKITDFKSSLNFSPGGTAVWTFTVHKNGAAQPLTLQFGSGDDWATDVAHEVDVVAGDVVDIRQTVAGGGAGINRRIRYCLRFTPTNYNELNLMGSGHFQSSSPPYYYPCVKGNGLIGGVSTLWGSQVPWPTAGTIKNLYVELQAAPGVGKTYTMTFRKANIDQTVSASVTGAATTGSDTTHDFHVDAGDLLHLSVTAIGAPGAKMGIWGFTWVPDIPGESVVASTLSGLNSNTILKAHILGMHMQSQSWVTDHTFAKQLMDDVTLRKLYVMLDGSPGAGNSFTFRVDKDSVLTALSCQIANAATSCNNVADDVPFAEGNLVHLESYPVSSPAARKVAWSVVILAN